MIKVAFTTFKCNLRLVEQDQINEHYLNVHNIEGVTSLSPLQAIEVDSKVAFALPSLLKIEGAGPDRLKQIITSVYYRCVSRGVIHNSTKPS